MAYVAELLSDHIKTFNIIVGDITHTEQAQERPLDLLNENISVEAALQLSTTAKRAAAFLRQAKVLVKTLEPNFCHAKVYLFHHDSNLPVDHYFLTGSSNLTEAGIGLKTTQNVELNIAGQGTDADYNELKAWFKALWTCPQAHDDKLADGKRIPFKTYLLREIEKLFVTYTPKDLYYKVLFELFGSQVLEGSADPDFNRQLGKLENTAIYNALYDFQRKGAMSLIRMLQKHNGAILADAVGLGKTWTALAVMKFFQLEGYQIFLLCPKKLEQNWRQYQVDQNSRFEADHLHYIIRFHTDLQDTRLEKDGRTIARHFQSDRPKLLVIDESHNLRNAKSSRYKFLVETLLKGNDDIKVLMLSATPINNTLLDVRNQFKLMVKDDPRGFRETLDIQNIDATFRTAQQAFHEWRKQEQRTIGEFIKRLPANFFKLTDALTLARTRAMIAKEKGVQPLADFSNGEALSRQFGRPAGARRGGGRGGRGGDGGGNDLAQRPDLFPAGRGRGAGRQRGRGFGGPGLPGALFPPAALFLLPAHVQADHAHHRVGQPAHRPPARPDPAPAPGIKAPARAGTGQQASPVEGNQGALGPRSGQPGAFGDPGHA